MDTPIDIKGIREGLLIHLPPGYWEEIFPALLDTIERKGDFLRGAKIAIQLEDRELKASQLGALREALGDRGVKLRAVLSTSRVTREAARNLGLEVELANAKTTPLHEEETFDTELLGEEAVLVQRTLRSGHSLRHPGHVVVFGDVNPGAEIIAGGHIIVWGKLRGTVHAGASGDENAIVCALDLAPTQLRIASHVAISPDRRGKPKPEMARLRQGQVVAESWK